MPQANKTYGCAPSANTVHRGEQVQNPSQPKPWQSGKQRPATSRHPTPFPLTSSKVGALRDKDATVNIHAEPHFQTMRSYQLSLSWERSGRLSLLKFRCGCVWVCVRGVFLCFPLISLQLSSPVSWGYFTLNKHCLVLGRENSSI